ncbi:Kinesin-like protein KIN-12D [Linum perenne]
MKIMFAEERSSKEEAIENSRSLTRALDLAKENLLVLTEQYDDVSQELKETKLVVEALESDQIRAMTEIEDLRKNNSHYVKLLRDKETEIMCLKQQTPPNALLAKNFEDQDSALTKKLKRMQESIEKAKEMNSWYCNDNARQASNEAEVDEVRRQAEAETVEAIICLEEELGVLQHQVQEFNLKEAEAQSSVMVLEAKLKETHDKLDLVTEVNNELLGKLEQKEQELKELTQEWELLACEMEEILSDGHEAVMDASDQLEEISSSLPEKRIWISEQVSRLIRTVSEKELLVEELGKCLEDASHQRSDVEYMIKSLRGAALVMNEAHQQECNEKEQELLALKSQLKDRTFTITELENKLKLAECHASNALLCAAIEFVIMKRFSGMNLNSLNELRCKEVDLSKLVEVNERQETLLHDQAATLEGADEEIRSLRSEIEELKKTCNILQQALSEEEKRSSSMQLQLEAIEENDILQTRERLAELKTEVLSLHHSCIGADFRDDNASEKDGTLEACARNVHTFGLVSYSTPKHSRNRDVTIALLKGEIESALASLQDVRTEMGRLHAEKEQFQMSERQSKETVELVTTQLLAMQATISDFEKQFELKIDVVNHKLQAFEQVVQEAMDNWSETKEYVEMEVGDAKLIASQKAAEASCLFGKFEEAQYTMKEADIMINKLVIANDTMKLEIEKQKQMELTLINEKENLIEEVQSLQAASCDKDQQLEDLERQFSQSLKDTTCIVQDLEDIVAGIHSSFHENSMSVADDLNNLKSFALDSRKMVSSLLEDVWSDIIMKDCAVTVLHHCHMGIMLETVTGLHTENGLLQHGLCETNSVIADLKERNSRSGRELQVCRTLEGKLLADIKGSFDRISRKEEETGGLGVKLTAFEKRIFDLQHQEEMMLERSNQIGSQLNILMKELDTSNYDVMETLLTQEKLLKDKEQCFNSEADILLMDILSKEFESCIVASHLKDLACQRLEADVMVLEDLKLKSAEIESSRSSIDVSSMEKQTLQEKVTFLEASVASLQADLEMRSSEVDELVNSRSAIMADLCTERTNGQNIVSRVTKLEDENALLQNELRSSKLGFIEAFNRLSSRNVECLHAVETIQASFYRLCSAMEEESTALAHKIFNEFSEKIERTSVFIQEIDSLECCAENVVSENMSLQAEMSRKDDILKGMSFDLSLLQESASNTKDLKDKMEALENDLAVKSDWLDEAIQNNQALEAQLQEKSVKVSDLELELANESESLKTCSSENTELRAQIKEILSAKTSLELELAKSMSLTESLGMELSQMENDLQQTDSKLEASQSSLNELTNERHHLLIEIDGLREQLEKAEILAEENEAIAMVAKQEAESQKIHAQDKEAEVELLERSVEELECTINVLENKVRAVKFRHLEDKEKSLEEALVHIETLKRDVTDKDAEIVQLKAHISELNLHAEAQASEYKQKFKALETMVEQLKHEGSFNNAANTSANKSEKFAVKPRGSGSPFKCIGLGLAQQIKSEKDEEMSASRLRIEELECLAASRQKEIFALHARLASAESMTHDVIRDLLGVKLDMTNYASLLNNQQLQKIAEKAQFSCLESQIQDDDIMQLKKQLQEFIEERRGWIEEINRKQTEMVAAQVALEDLRQQDQFLKAENEMLKMETVSHKKQLTELEGEVKKLSGQQNLQQRIHHHAKIKKKSVCCVHPQQDENHALKVQNEELSSKLHRAEMMLSRGRDEIVRYRESIERIPAMPIEEKKKVMNMLKVSTVFTF